MKVPPQLHISFYFQNEGSFHPWGESGESEARKGTQDRTPQVDCNSNEIIVIFRKNVSGEKVEKVVEKFTSPLSLLLLSGLKVFITSFS